MVPLHCDLKSSAKTACSCSAYGLPSWMVAADLTLRTSQAYFATAAPCTLSLYAVRKKYGPPYCSCCGLVRPGAVLDGEIMTMWAGPSTCSAVTAVREQ